MPTLSGPFGYVFTFTSAYKILFSISKVLKALCFSETYELLF